MKRLSHEQRAYRRHEIIDAYNEGVEIDALAARFGLSTGYVYSLISGSWAAADRRKAKRGDIRESLEAHRDAGRTKHETAAALGKSYQWVNRWCRNLGIEFPHGATTKTPSERNAAIVDMFDGGATLQEIGVKFDITRERVRQIVDRAGRTPRLETAKAQRLELFEQFRASGLSAKEFSETHNIAYANLKTLARDFNYTPPRAPRQIDDPKFAPLIEAVKTGRSIRSVAIEAGVVPQMLGRACQEAGVGSRHGRWKDFSRRGQLISELYGKGKSWEEIAQAISLAEGSDVGWSAARNWAVNNLSLPKRRGRGSLKSDRRIQKTAKPKPPSLEVIVCGDVKATAKANYGRCPASKIGARLGVTRNVIIGHWNRLRAAGELSA